MSVHSLQINQSQSPYWLHLWTGLNPMKWTNLLTISKQLIKSRKMNKKFPELLLHSKASSCRSGHFWCCHSVSFSVWPHTLSKQKSGIRGFSSGPVRLRENWLTSKNQWKIRDFYYSKKVSFVNLFQLTCPYKNSLFFNGSILVQLRQVVLKVSARSFPSD